MNSIFNFEQIQELTEKVLDVKKVVIPGKCRSMESVLPRAVCCMIARNEEGIKHSTIAKIINKNRATVYYYERKHARYMKFWGAYKRAYNKVLNEYNSINDFKIIFNNKHKFVEHLTLNKILSSDSNEITIHLYCGKIYVNINTTYLEFSNTFDKIKLALKDYNFKYKIKALHE